MNWEQIEANWKQVKGRVKKKWGQLTDDELEEMSGQKAQIAGALLKRYGYAKERAEKELDDFCKSCNDCECC